MRIVDTGNPQALAGLFEAGVFVEEDTDARRLQVRHDFDDVVVSKDGEDPASEFGGDALYVAEAVVEIPGRVVGEVAGDDGQVVRSAAYAVDDHIGKAGHKVEVKVG